MKIDAGTLQLSSKHNDTHLDYHYRTLEISTLSSPMVSSQSGNDPLRTDGMARFDSVQISEQAQLALRACQSEQLVSNSLVKRSDGEMTVLSENSKTVSEIMVGELLGRDVSMTRFTPGGTATADSLFPTIRLSEQIGIEFHQYRYQRQEASTTIVAQGFVTTADGREIGFELSLAMDRTWELEAESSMRMEGSVEAQIDPLVITLDGPAPQLSDAKFEFDLDVDGNTEYISHLEPGSGFLVFDKNEDGVINDGSEMFGTKTGNGFAELAVYDGDANGWIDENDAIYDKLKIWCRDPFGKDRLMTLRDADVGAISVNSIASEFDMKNEANRLNGSMVSTGIYLTEDGEARTLHQIDLAAAETDATKNGSLGIADEVIGVDDRKREELRSFMDVMLKLEQMRITAQEEFRRFMEENRGPSKEKEKSEEPAHPHNLLAEMLDSLLHKSRETAQDAVPSHEAEAGG